MKTFKIKKRKTLFFVTLHDEAGNRFTIGNGNFDSTTENGEIYPTESLDDAMLVWAEARNFAKNNAWVKGGAISVTEIGFDADDDIVSEETINLDSL